MAQTNYTPISLYYSTTAAAVPVNTNLASGELAINITDGILFYKDNGGTVQKIGYKLRPTNAGGTGLTSFTANGIVYASSTSALTTGSALTFDGTNLVNTSSSVGTPEIAIANSATSAGANARLRLKTGVSGATTLGDAFVQFTDSLNFNWAIGAGSSTSNALTFNQYFGLGSNELMRLTSTGLGIGTSSPSTKLDVVGGSIRINEDSAGTKVLSLRSNYAGLGPAINVTTNDSLLFLTNNTLQATLSASGNLGLGVTPSAWLTSGGTRVLQFAGGSVWSYATDRIAMIQNAYLNSGGNYIYVATDAASHYRLASGVHAWFNAPSGTAGNAITFTQAMTLDASGNLLVGTTSYGGSANVAGFGANPVGQIAVERNGGAAGVFNRFSSDGQLLIFRRQGTTVGTIDVTTVLTTYNTTSDYRLKNITGALTGAKDFIMALQPKQGTWKADGSKFVGFLAHEFQEVSPSSVTGVKDAIDADGKPIMQAMQASSAEVMANLVAFVQELKAEFDAYKASHP